MRIYRKIWILPTLILPLLSWNAQGHDRDEDYWPKLPSIENRLPPLRALRQELHLNDQQFEEISEIMLETRKERREIMKEASDELSKVYAETKKDINKQLTPEQRETLADMEKSHDYWKDEVGRWKDRLENRQQRRQDDDWNNYHDRKSHDRKWQRHHED